MRPGQSQRSAESVVSVKLLLIVLYAPPHIASSQTEQLLLSLHTEKKWTYPVKANTFEPHLPDHPRPPSLPFYTPYRSSTSQLHSLPLISPQERPRPFPGINKAFRRVHGHSRSCYECDPGFRACSARFGTSTDCVQCGVEFGDSGGGVREGRRGGER